MSTMAYGGPAEGGPPVPLAELVGGLALACDLANGYPPEKVLRTALLAVELARRAGLAAASVRDAYWVTTLRFLGCTAFSHEEAHRYGAGDDGQTRNVMALADVAQPLPTARAIATRLGQGGALAERGRAVARMLFDGKALEQHARAQCDVSVRLAQIVGLSEAICTALAQVCERFDGRGAPHGAAMNAIAVATRCLHVADVAEVVRHRAGERAALEELRRRAGRHLDPRLVKVFEAEAGELFATISGDSVWERFLAAEPEPAAVADTSQTHAVAFAFACFADLKSVFTLGHLASRTSPAPPLRCSG